VCRRRVPFAAALLEAVAVAVHLQDVDVVSERVEERTRQAFGTEDLGPFVERQIAGQQNRCALVALAEDFEE